MTSFILDPCLEFCPTRTTSCPTGRPPGTRGLLCGGSDYRFHGKKNAKSLSYRRTGQQDMIRFKNITDSFILYNQSEPCPNQNQSKLVIIDYQNSYPREKEVSEISISSERLSERPGLIKVAVAAVKIQRFRIFQKVHVLLLLSEKTGDFLCSKLSPK